MTKRALTVGINAYPHAPLRGCVNDALDWAAVLERTDHYVGTLLDETATKANILRALRDRVDASRFGDRIVFCFSGHGSWVPDQNGDEADSRDEVLCAYDYESGGIITDDELAEVFSHRRFGVRVTVISDSCHSGSVSRFVSRYEKREKYLSPLLFVAEEERPRVMDAMGKPATAKPRTGVVLFSGCSDEEYSYDAVIDGRPRGAFTAAALAALEQGMSYTRWHRATRALLPSPEYPQSPQFYASLWQRRWTL